MFKRYCNLPKNHSFFLFGARGTGKTSLLRTSIPSEKTLWLDLLNQNTEDRYRSDPELLYSECKTTQPEWVVIDEIQKIPRLLDAVHRIIENTEFLAPHFALTGSSARKLRHGGANLLAGRAFIRNLFPLTYIELGDKFDLSNVLNYGSLPKVFALNTVSDKEDFLASYGLTYLKEEVWAEHLIQELDSFRKFLEVAAQSNGKIVNFALVARDCLVHEKTAKKYYQILEDTLLGFFLEPYHRSVRKRQSKSPKFYLFDTGVQRALSRSLRQFVTPGTYAYGFAFEHLVISEAMRLNEYFKLDYRFSFFQTKDGGEIDLVIERPGKPLALVEIKSSVRTDEHDTAYLRSVKNDFGICECYCLSLDPHQRDIFGVQHFHWQSGLKALGFSE
ncbi:MAG: AAA family ATPase [Proteobacteria bacterium]|nr:AAA family ATPase [Pseudomonadota bacterium]